MKEFRYVGNHADTLENGRPIEPGQYTGPINEKATKHRQLIRDELLLEVPDGTADAYATGEADEVSYATESVREGLGHSDNDDAAREEPDPSGITPGADPNEEANQ